jgi:hypothetical protein
MRLADPFPPRASRVRFPFPMQPRRRPAPRLPVVPVALVALALALAVAPRPAAARPFVRGVALGLYSEIGPGPLERKLFEIASLGASHVSVPVVWSSLDVHSSTILPREGRSTPDETVARIAERARRHGLRVFLFPFIEVQRRKAQEWRGAIRPASWDVWWTHYRRFILHYAALAERTGADLLCVGSELVTTEKMRERWVELIREVRAVYRGRLVYSANWDHYEPVTFWDRVDVIGLTSYYKVAEKNDSSEEEMTAAWRRIADRLAEWSRKVSRPVVFTEVGYPSLDGGAVQPWNYTLATPADPEEQRRAYRAFVRAWDGVKELGGVFFWDWYGDGGPRDTRYTPRGKPAEKVVRDWYRKKSMVDSR